VDLNLVNAEFREYFSSGVLPSPALVLLTPWDDSRHQLPVELAEFSRRGYVVDFLPMSFRVGPGPFVIPSQLISLGQDGQLSRQIRQNGRWIRYVLRNSSHLFCLEAHLPAFLTDAVPQVINIALDAVNPGANITFALALLPNDTPITGALPPPWNITIKPSEATGQNFRFHSLPPGKVVDPITGRMRLVLQARQKQTITNILETERTNAWKVNSLRISVTAQLPPDATARRF